jgi:hypothetical protein
MIALTLIAEVTMHAESRRTSALPKARFEKREIFIFTSALVVWPSIVLSMLDWVQELVSIKQRPRGETRI